MEKNNVLDELEEVIGLEAAKRLVEYFAGSSLYIPQSIVINEQHDKMRKEFKNGASYRELAVRYGYTVRHVRRIIHKRDIESYPKKSPDQNPQLDLWG